MHFAATLTGNTDCLGLVSCLMEVFAAVAQCNTATWKLNQRNV